MKTRIGHLAAACLLLTGCGKPDLEPLRELRNEVYEPRVLAQYIEELRKANIPFRQEGNVIFYAKEDQERANRAFDEALENRPQGFRFTDANSRDEFFILVKAAGITADAAEDAEAEHDLRYVVYVPKSEYEKARGILREHFLQKPGSGPSK